MKTKAYKLPCSILGKQSYRKVIVWHIVDGRANMEEIFTPDKKRPKNERKEIIAKFLRDQGFSINELE